MNRSFARKVDVIFKGTHDNFTTGRWYECLKVVDGDTVRYVTINDHGELDIFLKEDVE